MDGCAVRNRCGLSFSRVFAGGECVYHSRWPLEVSSHARHRSAAGDARGAQLLGTSVRNERSQDNQSEQPARPVRASAARARNQLCIILQPYTSIARPLARPQGLTSCLSPLRFSAPSACSPSPRRCRPPVQAAAPSASASACTSPAFSSRCVVRLPRRRVSVAQSIFAETWRLHQQSLLRM